MNSGGDEVGSGVGVRSQIPVRFGVDFGGYGVRFSGYGMGFSGYGHGNPQKRNVGSLTSTSQPRFKVVASISLAKTNQIRPPFSQVAQGVFGKASAYCGYKSGPYSKYSRAISGKNTGLFGSGGSGSCVGENEGGKAVAGVGEDVKGGDEASTPFTKWANPPTVATAIISSIGNTLLRDIATIRITYRLNDRL